MNTHISKQFRLRNIGLILVKSISKSNVLIFGIDKDIIPSFVIRNSYEFSFVSWAAIGLARKNLPNVNQFFESLYKDWRRERYAHPAKREDLER